MSPEDTEAADSAVAETASAKQSAGESADPSAEQERLIAEHEAAHGPLPGRILAELRSGTQRTGAVGAKAVGVLGEATEALRLEIVETMLEGPRALAGHALGMRLLIPAAGFHGPRETPALVYLFGDAIALRPTDDTPMSAVPLYGLHIVMPHVAVARWMYKAGRTAHSNIDLAKDERNVEASLATWTIDDFREADGKLEVFLLADLPGPVHLYQHLGLVHLALVPPGKPMVRMKSALVETPASYKRLWDLFTKVVGTDKLSANRPEGEPAGKSSN